MKPIVAICTFTILLQTTVLGQTISGQIKDEAGQILPATSVTLLKAKDSTVAKMNATNNQGLYQFENMAPGTYVISANRIGFAQANSQNFDYNGENLKIADLVLEKRATQLANVTVTAKKPLIEVKTDRMVVNIEGTINAVGNDALELLRRSPGVLIDKDDNISMAGKNGVEVYIDGKPSPLRGADLANYLRSVTSSAIESIELITNPSAKYDAAGNAGIINIRFKKDKSMGTNGGANFGYAQGVFPKYNAGFHLNYRNKKLNLFGNYSLYSGKTNSTTELYRVQTDSIFDQNVRQIHDRFAHNFKAGLDYFVSSKSTFGLMMSGNIADNNMHSDGPLRISYKASQSLDKILIATTDIKMPRTNLNFNANFKYNDTKKGTEWNLDADYGFYNLSNSQFLPNIYYKADGVTEYARNVYRMYAPTRMDLASFKADYEKTLGKGKLGMGGKISQVTSKNIFDRYNVINATDIRDRDKSNQFDYKENINALYISYNRPLKSNLAIQLGLRGEQTVSKGRSTGEVWNTTLQQYQAYDSSTNRNYFDLFPSASLSFTKNPMSQVSISFSRRIDRPRYERLNPFELKLNDYLYNKGNTQLLPQYTHSFEAAHTYKYKLTSKLGYSRVNGMFLQVFEPVEGSKMVQTVKNLAKQDVVSLNITYPFTYKSLTIFNSLTTNYSHYQADFGINRKIDQNMMNVQYYMQTSYKFGKKQDWTSEISALYLSPFMWEGIFKGKSMGFVDLGVQKTVLKGQGNIKLSVSDIFNTMHFRGEGNYAGVFNRVAANWESQQVKINFTYRFGSKLVKAARQRKTGLEDEAGRTNGGSSNPGQ